MSWTVERIDLLKRLWGEGLSASQIAGQLGGGVSRNAVIGKVHRLKLESRLKAVITEVAAVKARPAETEVEVEIAPRLVAAQGALRPVVHTLGATALKIEPEIDLVAEPAERRQGTGDVVPISRNLTLVQLSDRTCKWPIGDPLAASFRFCGNHSGDASPYCRYHARIAFQPVSERRRAR